MLTIKGQSLEEWKNWIKGELTPPITVADDVKYTLEAFLELIEKFEKGMRKGYY